MRINSLLFLLIVFNSNILHASVYYVSVNGNDSNTGTIDKPLSSVQKAQELVKPGDTVYIRGGRYIMTDEDISRVVHRINACLTFLDKSGTPGNRIHYMAYPGERPVFDFTAVKPAGERVTGFWVQGNYLHFKGVEITGIQVTIHKHTESYGIYSWGSHNIFENLSIHDNVGTGLRHRQGGYNLFLNIDSYRNYDSVSEDGRGGNSDGFGCHPAESGKGNVFRGCRSWFNSDDGYDCIRARASITFDHCWSFFNGYSTSFRSLADGNGFKAGGYNRDDSYMLPDTIPSHVIMFCLAVNNKANGFYSNHHLAGDFWYNNSAYRNGNNYNMVNRESRQSKNINVQGYGHVLKNNLSFEASGRELVNVDTSKCVLKNNSFDLPVTITDKDFLSLAMKELTAPRKPGGSLPDTDFMKLAPGSDLIDKGVDIGFPFYGKAPDMGAFEYIAHENN
jgi:hypothetical protein